MLKKKRLYKLAKAATIIGISAMFVLTGTSHISIHLNDRDISRYNKSIILIDSKLNVSKGPIKVNLYDFNDKEIQVIKSAIKEIDVLSDNINYVFSDEKDLHTDQVINIYNNMEIDDPNIVGLTDTPKVNFITGEIGYPININLKAGLINYCYDRDKNKTLLSHVVTHEMLHTLGFNDLRSDNWLGKTVMYYEMDASSNYGVIGLTELDKQDIITRYGGSCDNIENE